MSEWWLLLHVATAFWLVAGLAGRDVTLAKARASTSVDTVTTLSELAGRFDRLMVIPGSLAVLVLGLATMWSQGRSLTGEGAWWLLAALVLYVSLIPMIPLVFIPKGKAFDASLAEAQELGTMTPSLTHALHDRVVLAARMYERIVVAVIIVLMVTKPF